MRSWKYKGIEWFYDEDGDGSSWKSPAQIDDGFRLPTIAEVITLIDYDSQYLTCSELPSQIKGKVWTKHAYFKGHDLYFCVDLDTGQVYPATASNVNTLLLVRE